MSGSTWFGLLLTGTIILSVSCESIKVYDQFDNLDSKNDVIAAKRPSFFVGSRYGRSQYGPQVMRNLNVVPRNDRFFLGSRYGKRSDEYMQDVVDPEPSRDTRLQSGSMMTCMYTGVKDFYRCYKVKTINSSRSSSSNTMEPSIVSASSDSGIE